MKYYTQSELFKGTYLNDAINTDSKRKLATIKNAVMVNGVIQCPGWHCGGTSSPFKSSSLHTA